jgi:hypothetical protein
MTQSYDIVSNAKPTGKGNKIILKSIKHNRIGNNFPKSNSNANMAQTSESSPRPNNNLLKKMQELSKLKELTMDSNVNPERKALLKAVASPRDCQAYLHKYLKKELQEIGIKDIQIAEQAPQPTHPPQSLSIAIQPFLEPHNQPKPNPKPKIFPFKAQLSNNTHTFNKNINININESLSDRNQGSDGDERARGSIPHHIPSSVSSVLNSPSFNPFYNLPQQHLSQEPHSNLHKHKLDQHSGALSQRSNPRSVDSNLKREKTDSTKKKTRKAPEEEILANEMNEKFSNEKPILVFDYFNNKNTIMSNSSKSSSKKSEQLNQSISSRSSNDVNKSKQLGSFHLNNMNLETPKPGYNSQRNERIGQNTNSIQDSKGNSSGGIKINPFRYISSFNPGMHSSKPLQTPIKALPLNTSSNPNSNASSNLNSHREYSESDPKSKNTAKAVALPAPIQLQMKKDSKRREAAGSTINNRIEMINIYYMKNNNEPCANPHSLNPINMNMHMNSQLHSGTNAGCSGSAGSAGSGGSGGGSGVEGSGMIPFNYAAKPNPHECSLHKEKNSTFNSSNSSSIYSHKPHHLSTLSQIITNNPPPPLSKHPKHSPKHKHKLQFQNNNNNGSKSGEPQNLNQLQNAKLKESKQIINKPRATVILYTFFKSFFYGFAFLVSIGCE